MFKISYQQQQRARTLEPLNVRTNSSAAVTRVVQSCGNFSPIGRSLKFHIVSFSAVVDMTRLTCTSRAFQSFGNEEFFLRIIKSRFEITAQAENTKWLIRNERSITKVAVRIIAKYVGLVQVFIKKNHATANMRLMYERLKGLVVYSESVNVTRLLRELSAIKMIEPQLTHSFAGRGLLAFAEVGIKSVLFNDHERYQALCEATSHGKIAIVKLLLSLRPLGYHDRLSIITRSAVIGIADKSDFSSRQIEIVKFYEPQRLTPRDFKDFLNRVILENIRKHGNSRFLRLGLSYVVAMPESSKQRWIKQGFSLATRYVNLRAVKIFIRMGLISNLERNKMASWARTSGQPKIFNLLKQ